MGFTRPTQVTPRRPTHATDRLPLIFAVTILVPGLVLGFLGLIALLQERQLADLRAQEVDRVKLCARLCKGWWCDDLAGLSTLSVIIVVVDLIIVRYRTSEHHDMAPFYGKLVNGHRPPPSLSYQK